MIVLGVKPFMQPSPLKNPGGDCFACALKAAVDHLFPERPVDFETAWGAFMVDAHGGGKVLSNTWPTMRGAAYRLDYGLEVHADLIQPVFDLDIDSGSGWKFMPVGEWAYRLEAWLSARWIALVQMNLAGNREVPDHFAVLDGQRHFWKATGNGAFALAHETHVVCSARGAYWITTDDLLKNHGVAGLRLIRRDERERGDRA